LARGIVNSKASYAARVALALIHHPVVDKNGKTIAAAVTNLDLHDIARAAKTYGVEPFYVVTPLEDQQHLVTEIIDHWVTGVGARYNPDRRDALALIRLQSSLQATLEDLRARWEAEPQVVVTSAQMDASDLDWNGLRRLAAGDRPVLLLFGTAWGLAPEVIQAADFRLAPILGRNGYNHLAVRSAVSIVLDRMFAGDES
jgi:hypothetical protein